MKLMCGMFWSLMDRDYWWISCAIPPVVEDYYGLGRYSDFPFNIYYIRLIDVWNYNSLSLQPSVSVVTAVPFTTSNPFTNLSTTDSTTPLLVWEGRGRRRPRITNTCWFGIYFWAFSREGYTFTKKHFPSLYSNNSNV